MQPETTLDHRLAGLESRLGPAPTPSGLLEAMRSIDVHGLITCALDTAGRRYERDDMPHPDGSYRHPNGFTKLALGRLRYGGLLRVHIWDSHIPAVHNDVHDHRGGFASAVVAGRLVDEHFVVDPAGDLYSAYRDTPSPEGHELEGLGTEHLLLVERHARALGSCYAMTGDELHRSAPEILPTVTVVLEGAPKETSSRVFRHTQDLRSITVNGQSLTAREFRDCLERALSLC